MKKTTFPPFPTMSIYFVAYLEVRSKLIFIPPRWALCFYEICFFVNVYRKANLTQLIDFLVRYWSWFEEVKLKEWTEKTTKTILSPLREKSIWISIYSITMSQFFQRISDQWCNHFNTRSIINGALGHSFYGNRWNQPFNTTIL